MNRFGRAAIALAVVMLAVGSALAWLAAVQTSWSDGEWTVVVIAAGICAVSAAALLVASVRVLRVDRDVADAEAALRAELASGARAAEAVGVREWLLRSLIDHSSQMFSVKDREGRLVLTNPAWNLFFAGSERDLVGRKVSDILPSAAAANADRHDAETLQAGSAVDFAVDFQAADGTRKYVTSLKFPIPDPNGDMRWIGAIAEDVTERSDAAGALRASERDLRRILDNMIDVFFRTDPVGTIIMASPSVGGLLGIPLEQCLGRRITDFFVDGDGFPRFMRELDVHGGQLYGYEAAFRAVDGREIWVSTTAHYFTDEAGVPCGIEGVARDITERKRAEQALHRLSHAIDQSPVAVILTDTDGVVEYVNSRFSN